MAELPKLTESEAVRVRAWLLPQLGHAEFSDLLDRGLISSWSALGESGSPRADITDLGRAALAAYDAEQRRVIRVEAMRECEILVEKKTQYSWRGGGHALRSAAAAIRLLIAKEESNG